MKIEESYKITDKNFEVFKSETLYWIDRFGIHNWSIEINIDNEDDDCLASTTYNVEAMHAKISIEPVWAGFNPTDYDVARCGFHEVVEVLMCEMGDVANDLMSISTPAAVKRNLDSARHKVIKVLENILWKPDWEKRVKEQTGKKKKKG